MKRWTLFVLGIILSVAVTAGLWAAGFGGFAFALFLPFAFLGFGRNARQAPAASCASCGYRARGPDEVFCPRDGSRLMPST